MAPEVDVFPFHIINLHIQLDKFLQSFMFLGRTLKFPFALRQIGYERIVVKQSLQLLFQGSIFRFGIR